MCVTVCVSVFVHDHGKMSVTVYVYKFFCHILSQNIKGVDMNKGFCRCVFGDPLICNNVIVTAVFFSFTSDRTFWFSSKIGSCLLD